MRLEITCVTKAYSPYSRKNILYIGGHFPDGKRFKFTEVEAIIAIEENKYDFFTMKDGNVLDVIVSETIDGEIFLKSLIDLDHPSVLLNLPECP